MINSPKIFLNDRSGRQIIYQYHSHILEKVNEIIFRELDIEINEMSREEAFEIPSVLKLKNVLPPAIENIRVVNITGVDAQACGGTHVANTKEIGKIAIKKVENKGKNNRRIVFVLKE